MFRRLEGGTALLKETGPAVGTLTLQMSRLVSISSQNILLRLGLCRWSKSLPRGHGRIIEMAPALQQAAPRGKRRTVGALLPQQTVKLHGGWRSSPGSDWTRGTERRPGGSMRTSRGPTDANRFDWQPGVGGAHLRASSSLLLISSTRGLVPGWYESRAHNPLSYVPDSQFRSC